MILRRRIRLGYWRDGDRNVLVQRFGLAVEDHRQEDDDQKNQGNRPYQPPPCTFLELKLFVANCFRHELCGPMNSAGRPQAHLRVNITAPTEKQEPNTKILSF